MLCDFTTLAVDTIKCSQCGFTITTDADPEAVYRTCSADEPPRLEGCRFLGGPTADAHDAGGCRGRRTLFACRVHYQCLPFVNAQLIQRYKITVNCCETCGDKC